jgi:hypothetical protein
MSLTVPPDLHECHMAHSCPYQTTQHNNLEIRISIFVKTVALHGSSNIHGSFLQEQNFVNLEYVMRSGHLMLQLRKIYVFIILELLRGKREVT